MTLQQLLEWSHSDEADVGGVVCTKFALLAAEHFAGEVWGYFCENNPGAERGRDEGGHDFAVIGNFIVDPWVHHVFGEMETVVQLDTPRAIELYGDRSTWTPVGK